MHCSLTCGNRDGRVNYDKEWTGDDKYEVTDETASGTPTYKPMAGNKSRKAVVVTSVQDRRFLAAVADTMVCKEGTEGGSKYMPATPDASAFGAFGAHDQTPDVDHLTGKQRTKASHFAFNAAVCKQSMPTDAMRNRYVHCPRSLLRITGIDHINLSQVRFNTGIRWPPLRLAPSHPLATSAVAGGCETPLAISAVAGGVF